MYEQLTIWTELKRCGRCHLSKCVDLFKRDKSRKDGRYPACKACLGTQRGQRTKEEKEKAAIYHREYAQANSIRIKQNHKRWRDTNKDRVLEYWRDYHQRNPEYARSSTRNRRARLRNAEGSHNANEILQMYKDQEALCAYCAVFLDNEFDVDHMVPLSRGGTNDWRNLALTCVNCNRRKRDLTAEEFWMILAR